MLRMLSVLCSLWLAPEAVHAQADPAPQAQDLELAELLKRAVEAYEAGDLATARALFEAVHVRAPTARTLRSLGLVAFRERRFADAAELLEASLQSTVRPLPEELRGPAEQLLAEARAELPPIAPSELPPQLAPDVQAPRALPSRAEPKPQPLAGHPPASLDTARKRERRRLKRAGYALLGLGGALLIAGGSAGLLGVTRLEDMEDHCRRAEGGACPESEAQRLEQEAKLSLLSGLALSGAVLGAISAATGGVLLTVRRITVAESPPARGLGVTLSASF